MKYSLLFLSCWLAVGSAAAQPNSLSLAQAAPTKEASSTAAAAPDTVAAIHRLFAKRRLHRNLIAGGLGAGALVGAAASGSGASDGGGTGSSYGGAAVSFSGADYMLLYAIPAVPLILLDFAVHTRYSRKREARAIEEFQAHQLPARLKHKLKPRYFH